jgi:nucleoside-diphosphate-sugar epimerase
MLYSPNSTTHIAEQYMTNLLILGGSGFLSGTLARAALNRGQRVWALTRGQRPLPAGVIGLVADRRDQAGFAAALAGARVHWDLVVDCIAFAPQDIQQDIAVLGALTRQLLFVSTDFVYEPARRRFPQNEETEHYTSQGYGAQKRLCELELQQRTKGDMPWTIVRPCHIYGPGSQLGCLPAHGRDPQLITRLQAGESLRLVGGGHFLQQPVLAEDLVRVILDLGGRASAFWQTVCVAGPEFVESCEYYRMIAEILGVELRIEELPVGAYLTEHPEAAAFLCHRIYDLTRLRDSGISPPATPLAAGLRKQVASLTIGRL